MELHEFPVQNLSYAVWFVTANTAGTYIAVIFVVCRFTILLVRVGVALCTANCYIKSAGFKYFSGFEVFDLFTCGAYGFVFVKINKYFMAYGTCADSLEPITGAAQS